MQGPGPTCEGPTGEGRRQARSRPCASASHTHATIDRAGDLAAHRLLVRPGRQTRASGWAATPGRRPTRAQNEWVLVRQNLCSGGELDRKHLYAQSAPRFRPVSGSPHLPRRERREFCTAGAHWPPGVCGRPKGSGVKGQAPGALYSGAEMLNQASGYFGQVIVVPVWGQLAGSCP